MSKKTDKTEEENKGTYRPKITKQIDNVLHDVMLVLIANVDKPEFILNPEFNKLLKLLIDHQSRVKMIEVKIKEQEQDDK